MLSSTAEASGAGMSVEAQSLSLPAPKRPTVGPVANLAIRLGYTSVEERIEQVVNPLGLAARDFEALLSIASESHAAGRLSPVEIGCLLRRAWSVLAGLSGAECALEPRIDPDDFARASVREQRRQIHALRVSGYRRLRQLDPGWRSGLLGRRENRLALMIAAMLMVVAYILMASQLGSWSPFSWTKWNLGPVRVHDFDQRWRSIVLHRADQRDDEGIQIDGQTYGTGIGVYAPSRIEVEVIADGRRLSGRCGLPDEAVHGHILCRVLAGERLLFESGTLSSEHRIVDFSVPIPPGRRLILDVQSATDSLRDADGAWVDLHAD